MWIKGFYILVTSATLQSQLNGKDKQFLPAATKLRQGNIFTPVCHSVHRGGVCVVGGMHGRGRAWQGACVTGGWCAWHACPPPHIMQYGQ